MVDVERMVGEVRRAGRTRTPLAAVAASDLDPERRVAGPKKAGRKFGGKGGGGGWGLPGGAAAKSRGLSDRRRRRPVPVLVVTICTIFVIK